MILSLLRYIFELQIVKFVWYALRRRLSAHRNQHVAPESLRYLSWGYRSSQPGNQHTPQIIWSFWDGVDSPTVAACLRSWNAHSPGFRINFLNRSNIAEYLPSFPELPEHIPVQKVSNLIRLMLLERYGGIWMDSSTLVTQSLAWVIHMLDASEYEMLAFYNEFPDEYVTNHDRPIIENGFIAAKPNSQFISCWRSIYADCIQSSDYTKYFRSKSNFEELISNFKIKDEQYVGYFVCYIAAQCVMQNPKPYKILLLNAEDDYYYHYYATKPPRNRRRFAENLLLQDTSSFTPKLIKVTGGHRAVIDDYIRFRCYRKRSILGQYLAPQPNN
jgi:hypothetical protein